MLGGLLALGSISCKTNPETPSPIDAVGTPTEVGTPLGNAVSKKIGPQGGTLTSHDGLVELSIPAGALAQETTISIEPIQNYALHGVGTAYRFLPDGQQFGQPATLKLKYSDADVADSAPEALGIAYQRADRAWYNMPGKKLDKQKREVTVPMPHFSDWSLFEEFHLTATKSFLAYGEMTELELMQLAPLTGQKEEPLILKNGGTSGTKWAVAGGGTLKPNGASARYTAPITPSLPNPVTVSVEVAFANNPAKLILLKEIFVGTGYIKVNFLGKEHLFNLAAFLHDDDPAFSAVIGGTPNEAFSIEFAHGRTGTFPFSDVGENGRCRVNFAFNGGQQYDSGHSWCNDEYMIADGQVIFEEYQAGKFAKGTFSGNLIKYDDHCTKSGPAISGSFYVGTFTL